MRFGSSTYARSQALLLVSGHLPTTLSVASSPSVNVRLPAIPLRQPILSESEAKVFHDTFATLLGWYKGLALAQMGSQDCDLNDSIQILLLSIFKGEKGKKQQIFSPGNESETP